jgi:hypothetical protein
MRMQEMVLLEVRPHCFAGRDEKALHPLGTENSPASGRGQILTDAPAVEEHNGFEGFLF